MHSVMPPLHLPLEVDAHAAPLDLEAAIKAACRQLLPGWAALPDEHVSIGFIAGGISNALYKVTPSLPASGGTADGQAAVPPPVAFRVYGDNTEQFIDRTKELGIMQLVHDHGFGPQVLATFSTGRIEEFLFMRSLQPEEMAAPEFVPAIASTLRHFHDIPAPGARQARTPFGRIYEWLDIAEMFTFQDPQKQQAFAAFHFEALRADVRTVEAAAAAAQSPVVFSHNDLLSGNIMVPLVGEAASSQEAAARSGNGVAAGSSNVGGSDLASRQREVMTLIDFEYADWAPRGFDLGNHFCEYAGFEGDYTRYPDHQQAARFIEHYLASDSPGSGSAADDAVTRCVAEANVYALASHQYWGTWSLLQAKWSSIDFDYLSYAALRWGEYHRRKEEFLAAAAATFPQGSKA